MGTEPRTISKADALAEAYKRGLLPPDKKAAYEEAQRRGLVGAQPAQSPTPQPVAPRAPGGGFDMVPSSPAARREIMAPKPAPQPMAAAPGAQYSFQPTPEMVASAPMRAEVQANNEAQRAKGMIPLTTEQGTKWVADPAQQMGDIATQQRLDRENAERREAAAAYGAGQDMIITHDKSGQLRPGSPADDDVSKGIATSPQHGANAAIQATESTANLWPDALNGIFRRLNGSGNGLGNFNPDIVPRISLPKVPIPEGMESFSGSIGEGLAQFLISRKFVGSVAPGGGLAANLGKDAVAVGVGFDGSTGRMADMFDLNAIPEGPLRDYARFLQSQPEDSPIVGRFKNMLEDMTMSGPMLAPQTVVRGAQAVGNAVMPKPKPMTAGNAGGAAIEAARVAPQAPPAAQPSPAPVSQAPIPQEAVDAFNAMPRKAREAMLRTMQSTGSDAQANTVMSRIWRGLTGQFGNSQEAMAQLRSLNNLPPEQQTMYALELMQRYGGDVETALPAMGRSWATGGGRKDQLFGGRDRAREIMDQNIPDQINSQGPRVTEIAEQKFGAGVVPAGEALEQELDALSGAYDNILSTKRNPTGRLRAQEKKDAVFKARDDLTAMLTSPEVMRTLPPNVKTEIMMQASEDIRRLKFPPETIQNVILQGDGKVLAPLFNGYGALEWSPDLWAHLAKQYPTQAAHSLQSALRKAGDAAFRNGDATAGRYYKRLRGESGKGGLLDTLERAVPNYKETRLAYGDTKSAQEAFDILENFRAAAASEGDVGSIITSLKGLPQRHRDMAENQITSIIRQEIGRKVDSPKLSELGNADRLPTPNLTALSNQNFLNALEDVFGPRGKELADGIRLARAQTDALTSIHPRYNSRTTLNTEDVANAPKRYEDPTAVPGGVADGWVKGMAATAVPAAIWQPSAAPILLGAAAGKALYNGWKAGKLLNNTERNQLVDYLFRVRKPGDAAPPAPKKGIGSGGFIAGRAVRDAAIGATAGAAASGGDPNATLAGAVGGAGIGAARAVGRLKSSIIKPPTQPRRAPAVAPAAAQVAAPPQARPLPGQTSPAAYSATGAATGALVGAGLNPDDPGKGAVYGAIGGGVVGAGVGRLAKLGSPKPKAVKPPPGGGGKPPPVGAKAFVPAEGAPRIDTSSWTPTDFNAARKQLNEMMQDRRTATGQQLADLDSEITALRQALQVDGPPPEFNDVPMASRFNAPVEQPWPKGGADDKAIKSAIADKRWTTQPVPASKIIPTQDSVFFDYAKAAGRYAGDDRLPIVVKQGDQYFVADGHHRLMAQAGKDVVNARVIDLAPTSAGTGGKKPPAQAGFGGSKPLPMDEASRMQRGSKPPQGMIGNIAGRAAVGVGTGAAVSLTNDAFGQDDLGGKIGETERTIANLNKMLADFDSLSARDKQQLLKDAGFYAGKIDGNIAGATTEGIKQWKAQMAGAITKADSDLTELVRRDAYQRNHPDAFTEALREYGPTVAGLAAALGFKGLRGSAARKSVTQAAAASKDLNRLITKAPVTGMIHKDASRPANLNALWQKGGASADQLPFRQDSKGKWRPNPKAKPAEELFSESGAWQTVTKYVKGKDLAIILGGGLDAAAMQPFIDKANRDLAEAEAEWKANPSDETFKRVEDAKSAVMAYTLVQRIGIGVAGGRILGTIGGGYAKPRPNIPAAATEQAALKQFIAANKPPPKPRAPRKLPPPGGGGGK